MYNHHDLVRVTAQPPQQAWGVLCGLRSTTLSYQAHI
jgi:hypothetical protein